MHNIDIEGVAVDHIKWLTRKDPYLEENISTNDKEPIWDGDIKIYSEKRKKGSFKADDFRSKIPVQIKGEIVDSLELKETIKFQVEKKYISGFLKDQGALFFVVQIDKNNPDNKQAYYHDFLPNDLNRDYKNLRYNSKSYTFKILHDKENFLRAILVNFVLNSRKQISTYTKSISIDDIETKEGNIVFHYIPEKPIKTQREFLKEITSTNIRIPIYFKTKLGIEVPVDAPYSEGNLVALETINSPIFIDGVKYFDSFEKKYAKNEEIIKLGNSLVFTFKDNSKHFTSKIIGNTKERIKGLNYLLASLKNDTEQIKSYKSLLELYEKYETLITELNLTDIYPNDELNENDIITIEEIYDALILSKPLKILPNNKLSTLISYNITNQKIILFASKTKDNKFTLHLLDNIVIAPPNPEGNIMSSYLLVKNKELDYTNIDLNKMKNKIFEIEEKNNINVETSNWYNLFILELLKIYDRTNNRSFVDLAYEIILKVMKTEKNNIFIINYLQIVKRLFAKDEYNVELKKHKINPSNLSETIAWKILNDSNVKSDLIELERIDKDEYENFISYPIYTLYNK